MSPPFGFQRPLALCTLTQEECSQTSFTAHGFTAGRALKWRNVPVGRRSQRRGKRCMFSTTVALGSSSLRGDLAVWAVGDRPSWIPGCGGRHAETFVDPHVVVSMLDLCRQSLLGTSKERRYSVVLVALCNRERGVPARVEDENISAVLKQQLHQRRPANSRRLVQSGA